MDSNRTATAQLTGFLEERPERGIVQFSSAESMVVCRLSTQILMAIGSVLIVLVKVSDRFIR
ncbi:MAG: hypothetical protein AB8B87_21935 [Granulosicoccus sp.]